MKNKIVLFLCLAVFLNFSCTSMDPALKYPDMVADLDPFSVGTIDLSFDRLFSAKIKAGEADVIFYPRENKAALEFRHELIIYRQFWDQTARQHFIEAQDRYKKDESVKTVSKYNKTRAVYGKLKGKLEWQTFKFTSTYKSSPRLELGYRFRAEEPYFTVLQNSAAEETGTMSGTNPESVQISMYYTSAQAEKLALLFSQDYLLEMSRVKADSTKADNYTESDASGVLELTENDQSGVLESIDPELPENTDP